MITSNKLDIKLTPKELLIFKVSLSEKSYKIFKSLVFAGLAADMEELKTFLINHKNCNLDYACSRCIEVTKSFALLEDDDLEIFCNTLDELSDRISKQKGSRNSDLYLDLTRALLELLCTLTVNMTNEMSIRICLCIVNLLDTLFCESDSRITEHTYYEILRLLTSHKSKHDSAVGIFFIYFGIHHPDAIAGIVDTLLDVNNIDLETTFLILDKFLHWSSWSHEKYFWSSNGIEVWLISLVCASSRLVDLEKVLLYCQQHLKSLLTFLEEDHPRAPLGSLLRTITFIALAGFDWLPFDKHFAMVLKAVLPHKKALETIDGNVVFFDMIQSALKQETPEDQSTAALLNAHRLKQLSTKLSSCGSEILDLWKKAWQNVLAKGQALPRNFCIAPFPDLVRSARVGEFVGLRNRGNVCFGNSALQVLLHCTSFRELLSRDPQPGISEQNRHILKNLTDFFIKIAEAKGSLDSFHCITETSPRHFKARQQQDAGEYLSYVLNALIESMQPANTKQSPFNGELILETFCSQCDCCCKNPAEQFLLFFLPLLEPAPVVSASLLGGATSRAKQGRTEPCSSDQKKSPTLQQLMERYFSVISAENQIKECDHDNSKQRALFTCLPRCLFISLKIFNYSPEEGAVKITAPVTFTQELEISSSWIKSKTQPVKYQLKSIILHKGASIQHGHYIAIIRKDRFKWACLDDDFINFDSLHNLLKTTRATPYILSYEECD
ncbi:Ubiquitin carboxyl-terminal hydrolase 12 [Cichlidogyrus casuarinus]|uniref:Ubiquitin carboxyl-terminal hydrolase 12 n=1 Tax=Cichlidogyrus casuarinus TaxID=1844966 RepID=A0ABD2Q4Y5_9PLAT